MKVIMNTQSKSVVLLPEEPTWKASFRDWLEKDESFYILENLYTLTNHNFMGWSDMVVI